MKVLLIEPNAAPQEKEIGGGLKSLQHEVGGLIEAVYPFDDLVAIVCNEEGKLNGLPLNRALRDEDGDVYDIIAGPFLITGLTENSFGSLTDEQVKTYSEMYKRPEMFVQTGGRITVIPVEPAVEKSGRAAAFPAKPEEGKTFSGNAAMPARHSRDGGER